MKIENLTINRNKWGMHSLLNYSGKMCCLGFLALACGAIPEEIEGELRPARAPNIDWPKEFMFIKLKSNELVDSSLAAKAMNINDDEKLTWDEKEERLKVVFRRAGIKLRFIGRRKR